jgi:hypothetical protein
LGVEKVVMSIIYQYRNEDCAPRDNEEFGVVYLSDSDTVFWEQASLWEPIINDRYYTRGECSGGEWLEAIGSVALGYELPKKFGDDWPNIYPLSQAVGRVASSKDFDHAFLDSFSIIENGEQARRIDRTIERSQCQETLLQAVRRAPDSINRMTPREFEVLVAHALKYIGFSRVTLRRYSKDSGIDILAVMASSQNKEELVVVEVKHGRHGITLAILDRLNGVRDRESADRALAVTSGHVTRAAKTTYEAKHHYIAAYTLTELLAILSDRKDWTCTARGLWTKELTCEAECPQKTDMNQTPNQSPAAGQAGGQIA